MLAAIPGGTLPIRFRLMPISMVSMPILKMPVPFRRKLVPIGIGEVPIVAAIPMGGGAICCQVWQVLEQQLKQLWFRAPA